MRVHIAVGSWAATPKPYRYAAVATAVALLCGGWGYLYLKARAGDLSAANEVMAGLRELKEIDVRWSDWLIGTRLAPAGESGRRSTVEPTALARIQATLALKAFAGETPLPATTMAGIREALDARGKAIHAFAEAHGAYLSAFAAFVQETDAFAGAAKESLSGLSLGAVRNAQHVHDAVLRFAAQPSPDAAERVARAVERLANADVAERARPRMERLIGAARTAVEQKSAEEACFREAYFAASGPRLDSALRMFEQSFANVVADAERFRLYLAVYSGLLLILAAWLAWRVSGNYRVIGRLNRSLREANELLEQRVEQRTRELRNALEQLKEQEALLIQSEKMSSLGQMVAGVAHEVNTPLAYVKASLDSVRAGMPDVGAALSEVERLLHLLRAADADDSALAAQFGKVSAMLDTVRDRGPFGDFERRARDGLHGIERISELVANLKNFARLDRSKVAEFDLNEGLAATLAIAQGELKDRKVRQLLGAIPKVACTPSQINQVFLNLLTNAAQATAEGGSITVRTYQPDADHVAVEVSDDGHGISEEILPKIFDPFFTTKDVGKGTGLGLAITYRIVAGHGGRIDVASRVGAGTCFTVTLPVRPAPAVVEAIAA